MDILPVPAYCQRLLDEVHTVSGRPLVYAAIDSPMSHEIAIAGPDEPEHRLWYKRGCEAHRDHLLVKTAKHILRVWNEPESSRLIASYRHSETLPDEYSDELTARNPNLNDDELEVTAMQLYDRVFSLLTYVPTDLQVERVIADSFPHHRRKQIAWLRRAAEQDMAPYLGAWADFNVPRGVQIVLERMGLAYLSEAAVLSERDPADEYTHHPEYPAARRLIEHLDHLERQGREGDVEAIGRWADDLGLRDWYSVERL